MDNDGINTIGNTDAESGSNSSQLSINIQEESEHIDMVKSNMKLSVQELIAIEEESNTQESIPDTKNHFEISMYMKELADFINSSFSYVGVTSVDYIRGTGGIDCLQDTRVSSEKIQEYKELSKGISLSLKEAITSDKSDKCMQVKFLVNDIEDQFVIMGIESRTNDQELFKKDFIGLYNRFCTQDLLLIESRINNLYHKYIKSNSGALNTEYIKEVVKNNNKTGQVCFYYFFDIQEFKKFNDTYSHSVGDEVITAVVNHLSGLLRPSDKLVHTGGDEFVIIINVNNSNNQEEQKELCQKILNRMTSSTDNESNNEILAGSSKLPFFIDGKFVPIGLGFSGKICDPSRKQESWDEIQRDLSELFNDHKSKKGLIYRAANEVEELCDQGEYEEELFKCLFESGKWKDACINNMFNGNMHSTMFLMDFLKECNESIKNGTTDSMFATEYIKIKKYLHYAALMTMKPESDIRKFFGLSEKK
ncbi:MAG: diguanylate cyclase [Candidatus Gracilibacteria bacterium]|nr:diguanylate cyclase [Candidatus Gracilibacteria bacterium]